TRSASDWSSDVCSSDLYTFFVTGIIMLGSVFSVFLLYRDNPAKSAHSKSIESDAGQKARFWRRPEYVTTMLVLFFVNMADRTFEIGRASCRGGGQGCVG